MRNPIICILAGGLLVGLSACGEEPGSPTGTVPIAGPEYAETCVSTGYCPVEGITATAQGPGSPTDQTSQSECSYTSETECGQPTGGGGTGPVGPYPSPDDSTAARSYEEGPLVWAACVLAVLGSTYSVWEVANEFQGWWDAHREYDMAWRTWYATYDDPSIPDWEKAYNQLRLNQARQRENDARDDVSSATNASGWALAGAAVACGASMLIPGP